MQRYSDELNQRGFAITEVIYTSAEIQQITNLILRIHENKDDYGMRCFLQRTPGLLELLMNVPMRKLINEVAPGYFIIKSIYFDKPPQSNWFVNWHQDKIIFVKEKIETFGFKNWTDRDGEFGVQPPAEFLGNIVTVRIHLDDTTASNGALKVIPHSHSEGPLRSTSLAFSDSDSVLCEVQAGGVMLMKPLLFHSSKRSEGAKRRRVLHLEYCGLELPAALEWAQKMPVVSV